MNELLPIESEDLSACMEQKINRYLEGLDKYNQSDSQKILELCQVGKFLCTFFPEYEIMEVREGPDFIISNGIRSVGLEHQSIYKEDVLKRTGFFENIALLAEQEFDSDPEMPNFLVNCYLNKDVDYGNKHKKEILATFIKVIKEYVLKDRIIENNLFERLMKMDHTQKSVEVNFGGYMVPMLSDQKLLEAIQKKEQKLPEYIKNTSLPQWLLLLIGGVGEHSYYLRRNTQLDFKTSFERIFILEDFDNRFYELK
ncbi:hypothetical protein [Robiginitalea sediminis]|uniref:hypothetical protein n=1 Tax=Robiginitalea sediminis TaxID=1982593 RepID=UPI00117AE90C|nr:hypothetical protein [Robiginitalea sediminis]